jgi:undecaprenyl diphosphate synthase
MKLLVSSLKKEIKTLQDNDIKLTAIGNLDALPKKVNTELQEVIESTKSNTNMTLVLALSYGSREELIKTVKEISLKVKNNLISRDAIDESVINNHLYTRSLPDVDLLIRTSGEQRISNFLLWQLAYAELYFTDTLWPDFTKTHLYEALLNYQNRERRFGKTSEQLKR